VNLQFIADGLVAGATIGLGAVGVTLTYSILRFANFAHGEFISWGCYLTWAVAAVIGALSTASLDAIDPLSVGWNVILACLVAMALTGLIAIGLDTVLFRPLRARGASITAVIASFGASMAMRALLETLFSSRQRYLSQELQIAIPLGAGLRVTPDQIALIGVTGLLVIVLHVVLTRTSVGRAMRAVSENPSLARVVGIDVSRVVRLTWFLGGALACASGVMMGLIVQIRPTMGAELLLPLFAASIVGGIGSVGGALIGGLVVGLSEAVTVALVGAQWRAGVAFVVLIAVLLVRPNGLFGRAPG
jgi:branched-chain amino acid transport system permease protein